MTADRTKRAFSTPYSLPVSPIRKVYISDNDRREISRRAARLLQADRHLSSTAFFGTNVRAGNGAAPAILIGDNSEIPLLPPAGQNTLEYRIALLADQDDLIIVACDRYPDFENYMAGLLGLQKIEVLQARQTTAGPSLPTARRCVENRELFNILCDHVLANGGTTLVPHISTGTVWVLAKRLNEATNRPIFVAAPPPNLAARVNDKIWFGNIVVKLLGQTAVPTKFSAFGPAALTGHVHRLAERWEKLVIKIPDSAGSAGNFPVSSPVVREMDARTLQRYLRSLVTANGLPTPFPLMVEVWDCDVLSSPSVQLWIPDKADGDPIIEGVYDQFLVGDEARFVGAAQIDLPDNLDKALCRDAFRIALLAQELSYFGRFSLDAVIAAGSTGQPVIHWIECNGRWGGVSLPMTFLKRIFRSRALPAHIVVHRSELRFSGMPFQTALNRLRGQLYEMDSEPEGVILITPGGLEKGTAVHMIAIGSTQEDATQCADKALATLFDRAHD